MRHTTGRNLRFLSRLSPLLLVFSITIALGACATPKNIRLGGLLDDGDIMVLAYGSRSDTPTPGPWLFKYDSNGQSYLESNFGDAPVSGFTHFIQENADAWLALGPNEHGLGIVRIDENATLGSACALPFPDDAETEAIGFAHGAKGPLALALLRRELFVPETDDPTTRETLIRAQVSAEAGRDTKTFGGYHFEDTGARRFRTQSVLAACTGDLLPAQRVTLGMKAEALLTIGTSIVIGGRVRLPGKPARIALRLAAFSPDLAPLWERTYPVSDHAPQNRLHALFAAADGGFVMIASQSDGGGAFPASLAAFNLAADGTIRRRVALAEQVDPDGVLAARLPDGAFIAISRARAKDKTPVLAIQRISPDLGDIDSHDARTPAFRPMAIALSPNGDIALAGLFPPIIKSGQAEHPMLHAARLGSDLLLQWNVALPAEPLAGGFASPLAMQISADDRALIAVQGVSSEPTSVRIGSYYGDKREQAVSLFGLDFTSGALLWRKDMIPQESD